MEAKKKAEELVMKFATNGCWAKENAITCVNEILDTAMTGYLVNDSAVAEFQIRMRDYWKGVKTEIQKIIW